jgi:hypothetical protein
MLSPVLSSKSVSSYSHVVRRTTECDLLETSFTEHDSVLEANQDGDNVEQEHISSDDNDDDADNDSQSWEDDDGGQVPYDFTEKPTGIHCVENLCASWNILDPHMSFPVPEKFPKRADSTYNGNVPSGRDVSEISRNRQTWLVTINLTLQWLEDVARYAYHHVLTTIQHQGKRKSFYWNKQEFFTYCRTCGFTKALSISIEKAAKSGHPCPIPTRWKRERSLEKCHYAAMHMLFLGHVKSNMELFSKWLSAHEFLAKFGRQVNLSLTCIRDLRIHRFHALPLSTSSWGTGPWVSENYVFWQRTWKYYFGHPVLLDSPKLNKASLITQLSVVKRFVATSHACICSIMAPSTDGSQRMRMLIPLYLDTMVEMDEMTRETALRKKKKREVTL